MGSWYILAVISWSICFSSFFKYWSFIFVFWCLFYTIYLCCISGWYSRHQSDLQRAWNASTWTRSRHR